MTLIPQTRNHAEAIFALLDDDRLYAFIGGNPLTTLQALRERFIRLESRVSPDGRARWLNWVIGTAWQGRGYASEAANLLMTELSAQGVQSFKALIHSENVASQKVAQKLGMIRTIEIIEGEQLWKT